MSPGTIASSLATRALDSLLGGEPSVRGTGGFDALLGNRLGGSSGVTLAPGVDLDLSEDQLRRVADAADRAQRAGADRALVLLDGRAFELDVRARKVTGEASLAHGDVLTGIDAVIQAGDPASLDTRSSLWRAVHPSLRALLGS